METKEPLICFFNFKIPNKIVNLTFTTPYKIYNI